VHSHVCGAPGSAHARGVRYAAGTTDIHLSAGLVEVRGTQGASGSASLIIDGYVE